MTEKDELMYDQTCVYDTKRKYQYIVIFRVNQGFKLNLHFKIPNIDRYTESIFYQYNLKKT